MSPLLVAFVLAGSIDGPTTLEGSATRDYEAFVQEYAAALTAWDGRCSPGGESPAEDLVIPRYRDWPGWSFLPRAAAIAEGKSDDPGTIAAFFWVVEQTQSVGLRDEAI